MGKLDIGAVIQEAISRFSQNRIGDKPPVFVTLAPAFTQVPWQNQTAGRFRAPVYLRDSADERSRRAHRNFTQT